MLDGSEVGGGSDGKCRKQVGSLVGCSAWSSQCWCLYVAFAVFIQLDLFPLLPIESTDI